MTDDLQSAEAVIEALGGYDAVGRLTNRTYTAVWNWKKANAFPANTYLALNTALVSVGKRAPSSLWKMEVVEAVQ